MQHEGLRLCNIIILRGVLSKPVFPRGVEALPRQRRISAASLSGNPIDPIENAVSNLLIVGFGRPGRSALGAGYFSSRCSNREASEREWRSSRGSYYHGSVPKYT